MEQDERAILKKMGKTIAKKREGAGRTQEYVAEKLGIGTEAFSRIERGLVNPSVAKLYAMAKMFNCPIENFFIEGSRQATDQSEHIARLIDKLHVADRNFLVELVERLAFRFGNSPPNTSKKAPYLRK